MLQKKLLGGNKKQGQIPNFEAVTINGYCYKNRMVKFVALINNHMKTNTSIFFTSQTVAVYRTNTITDLHRLFNILA